ncbi:Ell-associated factor Eaf [Vitis vinifera]|uniref:Ell-associated factor Eaf n=1 Tax=Vitis vinifera TaxID=29760 RepID=A0A438EDI7_VITVI|nr:Ell-associated factor Eaf [Vitis vinifera]
MANKSINNKDEPSTAPESDRWYDLTLGSSFKDPHSSTKFCTLRYEFKPASIDKNQPGSLHKNKENRVTVEFHNNQPGKPKVTFEGSSEDYKENDAVLFFDGETFRLERLHRAVKRLRHVRLPGESAAAAATTAATTSVVPPVESYSPPIGKGAKLQSFNKSIAHPVPVSFLSE